MRFGRNLVLAQLALAASMGMRISLSEPSPSARQPRRDRVVPDSRPTIDTTPESRRARRRRLARQRSEST